MFTDNYWIGLSDLQEEGVWMWMETKTPVSQTRFTFWLTDQPNGGTTQNCVTMNGNNESGYWNDWYCNHNNLPYICEKPDG